MSKSIYTHKHHIIPKHAGGSDDPSNLKELTIEEHTLAHKKLFFIYGRPQDEWAYLGLSGAIGKDEIMRRASGHMKGKKQSAEHKEKVRLNSLGNKGMRGKTHTPESIEKMRKAKTGQRHTEATKEKLRLFNTGKIMDEETKQKISISAKGRVPWNKGIPAWNRGKKRTIVDGRIRYI